MGFRPVGAGLRAWSGAVLVAVLLAGCDAAGVVVPGPGGGHLASGLYSYRAWSDADGDLAWWGTLELEVTRVGEISGRYLLPDQCVDEYRVAIDCFGRIGGRIGTDGIIRFGMDEGWLAHEGTPSRDRVAGTWSTRLLGYRDGGSFTLAPAP